MTFAPTPSTPLATGPAQLRAAMCMALAALSLAQAWTILFVLKIGPVVVVIDASEGRAVHLGDAVAFPPVLMALVLCAHSWARRASRPTGSATTLVPRSIALRS